MRPLYFGCLVAGVAATMLAAGGAALAAEPAEVASPAKAGEAVTGPAQAPAGPSAAEVIGKLLSARSSLGPVDARFTWVIGPVGADQRALEGRLSIVDATHYRVDFGLSATEGGGGSVLLLPDGRWVYQFSTVPGELGLRVDLAYLKQQVRDPLPRASYDPTGGVLLELLAERGYVTYEGDEDSEAGRCAVLSYQGRSVRMPAALPAGTGAAPAARTRLRYRYEDGLLVTEDEVDGNGRFLSTYRLSAVRRVEPPAELLLVPESVHCIDVTRQYVRRLLYGRPPGTQPAEATTGLP